MRNDRKFSAVHDRVMELCLTDDAEMIRESQHTK